MKGGGAVRVLVACEESQEVCKAFRARGHEAYSCDLQESSGGHPEWHIKADALELLKMSWDMVIAFPPCTDLACSGAAWFAEKRADGRQQKSAEFFMRFAEADCTRIAIENPVGIMSTQYRKPDQIIQPFEFGHPYTKRTCLWLKNLPPLFPTEILAEPAGGWLNKHRTKDGKYGGYGGEWGRKQDGKWLRYGDPEVKKERSKTFPGIARAMAEQWG